jgi:hypothetical protein
MSATDPDRMPRHRVRNAVDAFCVARCGIGGRAPEQTLKSPDALSPMVPGYSPRQAEAIKLTCISQNFNDRRARVAQSD